LSLNNVSGRYADLYLRLNLPSDSQGIRQNFFKVWQNSDSIEKFPYNHTIASPYFLTGDLVLPLYGTGAAWLGEGRVNYSAIEGAYELLALLTFADNNRVLQTRKIVWISPRANQ
jgi:hypothetical protein